jgi:hypothetical protein
MPREFGPIIVPGPAGDEYRRSQERMKACNYSGRLEKPRERGWRWKEQREAMSILAVKVLEGYERGRFPARV